MAAAVCKRLAGAPVKDDATDVRGLLACVEHVHHALPEGKVHAVDGLAAHVDSSPCRSPVFLKRDPAGSILHLCSRGARVTRGDNTATTTLPARPAVRWCDGLSARLEAQELRTEALGREQHTAQQLRIAISNRPRALNLPVCRLYAHEFKCEECCLGQAQESGAAIARRKR